MYKQREAAFKEARLLAGLAEIDKGLQGLAIVRTSSATVSEGSEDGSKRAEQRKSIPKEIPEIAVDPSRAPLHYLLWANEVENVLLRTRPAEMWARAVAANLTGPAAAVARRAISENVLGGRAVKCSLLTGIYGVGSWEGVVEQEWDDCAVSEEGAEQRGVRSVREFSQVFQDLLRRFFRYFYYIRFRIYYTVSVV